VTNARLRHLVPRPVALVSAAVALSLLGDSLLYAVLPSQAEAIGVPIGLVGVLLSVNRFVRLLSNAWAGGVCARLGYGKPFTAALLLGAATTAVYGVVSGFWPLFWARVLWGVSWSFLRVGGLGTVLEQATDRDRGRLLGFFQGISRLGSLVAVALGGLLTDAIGYRPTLLLFAALSATAAAISAPSGGRTLHPSKGRPRRPSQSAALRPPPRAAALGEAPPRRLWAIYAGGYAHGFVMSGVVTATLGLLLKTLYGSAIAVGSLSIGVATLTGWLLASRWLIDFGLGPYLGHLSDRLGRHRVILTAFGGGSVALAIFASVSALLPLTLATIAIFTAGTALSAALEAALGDLAPAHQRARIIGRYTTFQDLGSACGPLLGYALGVWFGLGLMYGLGLGVFVGAAATYGWACGRGARR
jgi:MFS family permease